MDTIDERVFFEGGIRFIISTRVKVRWNVKVDGQTRITSSSRTRTKPEAWSPLEIRHMAP
ncbi:hypothetical protein BD410DRAFT_606321 [Rickenella mellea]|uniref:Uncharacterized protein n=1 Tax=Rickenella mellea TaxID=50990 RepID=A0A4Y7QDH2_9AGAM|nr:hypothetical protein BD410DRAFT_606321 [Rickenella mellea]